MKRILPVLLVLVVPIGGAVSSGCGYHVAGKADLMPKNIHTIYIEPFHAGIPRADIPRLLSADLARELLSRTRYKVVSDPQQADAVLAGAITNFASGSTTADPNTARSTGAMVVLQMNIYLTERGTGKSLFQSNGYEFRERYEISENAATYFDESGTAVERVTRDAARSIVSAILESF
ncbi:MAG TPA: LPS assembly lipoprotein LptE [Bryobacteraceae bacterium]|nr:LPS assembly lipoprotein LptE [Bryobacteraceae bacterium]